MPTDDGDVLWFSFLFNRSSDTAPDIHFYFVGNGGLNSGMGVFLNTSNQIAARINAQTGGHMVFSLGENHFVVGRITFSNDQDEVRFWLDPELDQVPLDTASNSGASSAAVNPASWNNVYLRHVGLAAHKIDEIRLETDFFSVAPSVAARELPGDYNGNGVVDAADFIVWRKNVGAATLNNRDPNGMGVVGPADYDFWRSHFGQTAGSGGGGLGGGDAFATTSAVPEPNAIWLVAIGAVAAFSSSGGRRLSRSNFAICAEVSRLCDLPRTCSRPGCEVSGRMIR